MKLHIFNPEHDMALAYNTDHVTLPHNIQEFKMNLGFLPALWAHDGDCVLVDDVAYAVKALAQTRLPHADVLFLTQSDLRHTSFDKVKPWGWNHALCAQLIANGVAKSCLPTDSRLATVRQLSNRSFTQPLLPQLRQGIMASTCGESICATTISEVEAYLAAHTSIVVKAPWSSSGRGVRYIYRGMDASLRGWIANIIQRQGCIMAEPCYNKTIDFAMEFQSDGKGTVSYCGLSLFQTEKGSYTGNLIATEQEKLQRIARYIDKQLTTAVSQRLQECLSAALGMQYEGPLGVDMMIVASDSGHGYLLHPCVEINLRRTMGHVALALAPQADHEVSLMQIYHDVNYKLRVVRQDETFVKVL